MLPVPTVPNGASYESAVFQQWLELLRKQANQPTVNRQATDPGTTGVPVGTWSVWKNTTSGLVKVWTNDGGVMKSVTLT